MKTQVCIVGGGPAGVILAYQLVQNDIDVILLEAQKDFDRNFRGDTIHYKVMELLDDLGLADGILGLPHHKMAQLGVEFDGETINFVDFTRLQTPFQFVTLVDQAVFLQYVVDQLQDAPNFKLMMQTQGRDLIWENKKVVGINIKTAGVEDLIRADLVVACDGRSSRIRKQAGFEFFETSDTIEVLWFRLPRKESDESIQLAGGFAGGRTPIVILERHDHYQLGLIFPQGGYRKIRKEGLEGFQQRVIEGVPALANRVSTITDWSQVAYLNVTGGRVKQWWRDGLLLIGDAAHVMTPVGGVGINYAIEDAIVAANVLVPALKAGTIETSHLTQIQAQRNRPIRIIQSVQGQAQRRLISPGLLDDEPFQFPTFMRILPKIPILRDLPSKFIGGGFSRVTVETI